MKNQKPDYSKFQKGTSIYICRICSKRTRDVGDDSASAELCSACYAKCLGENAVADGRDA